MIPEPIKQGIFAGESGGDYNALFGFSNRPGQPFSNVRLTDMSVNDVIRFTDPSSPYAQWVKDQLGYVATPVGGYQVVGTTLRDAVRGLGLTGNERFDQATQDAIGSWIYQTQGTGAWEGYRGPQSGGAPMGLLSMSTSGQPQQPEQPRTFWERLGDAGPMLMMMDPATRDAGVAFYNMNAEKQGKAEETQAKNRTAQYLRSLGTPQAMQAADALENGLIDGRMAYEIATKQPEPVDPWAGTKVIGNEVVRMGPNGAEVVYSNADDTGAGDVTYGLTPQRYVRPDGTMGLGVLGNDGTFKEVALPEGAMPAPNVDKIDAGDRWILMDQQGNIIGEQPKNLEAAAADTARGGVLGAAEGQALTGVGDAVAKAESTVALIDEIYNDPALPSVTGMFQGRLPALPLLSGGQAGANLNVKIEQLKGKAFLEAYNMLRGAGAITEQEGKAATAAMARLSQAQDHTAYKAALDELRVIIKTGADRARAKAAAAGGGTAPASGPKQKRGTFNPATNQVEWN